MGISSRIRKKNSTERGFEVQLLPYIWPSFIPMKNYNTLTTEVLEKTLLIRINRPESLNALNIELVGELQDLFDSVCDEDSIEDISINLHKILDNTLVYKK